MKKRKYNQVSRRRVAVLKSIVLILLLTANLPEIKAQSENQIGVRGGLHSGIYFQNLLPAGNAERSFFAMLSANNNSFRLTVMRLTYEMSISDLSDNLFLVWGYGGHAGLTLTDRAYFLGREYLFEYERFRPVVGIDAYGGVEYRFIGFPVAVGLGVKPFAEIMVPGFINIRPGDIGLSIAYRF